LVFRAQDMVSAGKLMNPNAKHIRDVFLWHPNIAASPNWSCIRVNYYTSAVGAENHIVDLEQQISKVNFQMGGGNHGQICPRVFKKDAKTKKVKLVDMSIAIDALRHSYNNHVEAIFLVTGDGDYLPLIQEVMRTGTQVWLGAVSDGLNASLPRSVDRFVDLDALFFVPHTQ
jgi:uncharacterized LabA/DUF88 family protein